MSVSVFHDTYVGLIWKNDNTNGKRFSFNGTNSIGSNINTQMHISGQFVWTGLGSGSHTFHWALGRQNDAYNTGYTLNPNSTDDANLTGDTTSEIVVYEYT